MTTLAGDGSAGYAGDGGPATNAHLYSPYAVAVDDAGSVFIADYYNSRIRKVATNGLITTVAGTGTNGYGGDGGPATNADLSDPTGVAVDSAGELLIADQGNNRIRKVDLHGIITTVAGNGNYSFFGDGGVATNAALRSPTGVAVDAAGDLFIADTYNERVRKVAPSGAGALLSLRNLTTNDGGSYQVIVTSPYGSITSAVATLTLLFPPSISVQPASQDIIAGSNVTFSVTAAGTAPLAYAWYRGDPAIAGATNSTYGTNHVQLADSGSQFSCVITNAYGSVTSRLATLTVGVPPAITAQPTNRIVLAGLSATFGLTLSGTGPFSYQWQLDGTNLPDDLITTVAGDGAATYSGDDATATNAALDAPYGVAVDALGNLFIADYENQRVRKVDSNDIITTVAGDGFNGFSGDGGPATNASLRYPAGVAADASGSIFIADSYNQRVRKVDTNGIITTVAGNGTAGYSGDGAAATNASLSYPNAVAVDGSGNLFIADTDNERIRKVDTAGVITTVAGNGVSGFSGDGAPATNALLSRPSALAVDASGDVFIADTYNYCIREVAANGLIMTVAGNGTGGYAGDGAPAVNAKLNDPYGVALDSAGDLFITDTYNERIRKVDLNGIITTVAGDGFNGFFGDGGPATEAELWQPTGVAVDASDNLFIGDSSNDRIRRVMPYGAAPMLPLANLAASNAGSYQVIVTSPFGSVTSAVATLTVLLPPSVTAQPASLHVVVGGNATFEVTAARDAAFRICVASRRRCHCQGHRLHLHHQRCAVG